MGSDLQRPNLPSSVPTQEWLGITLVRYYADEVLTFSLDFFSVRPLVTAHQAT